MHAIFQRLPEGRRRLGWGLVGLAIGAALAFAVGMAVSGNTESSDALTERKQIVDPPKGLTDFTLTSHTGEPLSLSDLRGKPILLFFGYTSCPDVCPTTMAEFRQVKRALGERGDDAAFVFISVDGSRDSPERVVAFVKQFDPNFIGLTGDEGKIEAIAGEYFLFFAKAEISGTPSAAGYLMDHTGYSYLIDGQGRLRVIYPYGTAASVMVNDLNEFLN